MPSNMCSVRRANGTVVIALPDEIDVTSADQVDTELAATLETGTQVLVVDMTATRFCDSRGVQALVRAYHRAAAAGVEMRVAASGPAVLRVLQLTGTDQVIALYPDMSTATDGLALTG